MNVVFSQWHLVRLFRRLLLCSIIGDLDRVLDLDLDSFFCQVIAMIYVFVELSLSVVLPFPLLLLQSLTVVCDLLCFLLDCVVCTVLFLVTWLLLIGLFDCVFLVVIDGWFPLLNLSPLVKVLQCLWYFQDSVLVVPFLLVC